MTAQTIRSFLSDPKVAERIKNELNAEIAYCPILRNLQREKEYGIIDDVAITFRKLGNEDRNEVFVYLGRILESVITCILAECPDLKVKKDRSSSGDLTVEEIVSAILDIWEIKGTSGNNSWTGSTHATKKEDEDMNFIGVRYGINEDVNMFDILSGDAKLIDEIFVIVMQNYSFIRKGSATDSNSRTQLLLSVDDYDLLKNQVAWGNVAYPQNFLKKNGERNKTVKYLQLECA
tara:strand:- start:955 stop:1656 length:702 start_codon:yes stop_codon:yes gene_type:complete